ncbi:F0F1 ATP synthase subunit gamma [Bradyrhizobium sp.]|uniref:F0F1 ATP synthase subunit gamma n=1 Tax=Bradyrhizobium sp. TaxID=376 RepID=UPI003C6F20DF
MAERLADIATQIQNVRQLEAVVTAMRGIAASRAQRGRSLLAGIEAYHAVISRAIGQALTMLGAPVMDPSRAHGRTALVLFCAEQGFAGAFSEHLFEHAAAELANALTFVVGTRGEIVARERGLSPSWTAAMATHVDAIPSLANRIADALYQHIAAATISKIEIVVSRSTAGGGIQIERRSLLPLDLSRFPQPGNRLPPLTTLPPHDLLERLTAEYVYAQLCDAAMHAYVTENQARMMTMTAAKSNIGDKLNTLSQRERQLRQEEITSEIIELASGTEALRRR